MKRNQAVGFGMTSVLLQHRKHQSAQASIPTQMLSLPGLIGSHTERSFSRMNWELLKFSGFHASFEYFLDEGFLFFGSRNNLETNSSKDMEAISFSGRIFFVITVSLLLLGVGIAYPQRAFLRKTIK